VTKDDVKRFQRTLDEAELAFDGLMDDVDDSLLCAVLDRVQDFCEEIGDLDAARYRLQVARNHARDDDCDDFGVPKFLRRGQH
jgi:hypothetical protein